MSFAAFDDAPTNGADPFAGGEEADPAADFLARQQNQMADLEGANDSFHDDLTHNNGNNGNSDGYYEEEVPTNGNGVEDSPQNDGFEVVEHSADVDFFGGSGGDAGSSGFLQETAAVADFEPAAGDEDSPSDNDFYSAIQREDRMAHEPEKIKRWREEFAQRITDKDAAEEKRRIDLREGAAKELVDWQRHYEEQMEKQRAANREAELAFIKQRDETTPGSEWERVCWLCDFNPKTSKQVKDVSRMRGLLLQLKQGQTTN